MKTWSSWPESSNIASQRGGAGRAALPGGGRREHRESQRPKGSFARWSGARRWKRSWSAAGGFRGRRRPPCCKSGCVPRASSRAGRPRAGGRCPSAARGGAGLPRRLGGRLRRRAEPEPGAGRRRAAALVGARRGRGHPRRRQDAGRPPGQPSGRAKRRRSSPRPPPMRRPRRSPSSASSGTRWPRPCPAVPS